MLAQQRRPARDYWLPAVKGLPPMESLATDLGQPLELAAVQVGEHVAKVPDLMGLEALLVESGLA